MIYRAYLKSTLFYAYWVVWTLLLAVPIPLLTIVRRAEYVREFSRIYSRGVVFGLKYTVGIVHEVTGTENLPKGPALYVCNHQSTWETIVFNLLVREVAIVLKRSLYGFPVIGWYLRHSPMVAVDRAGGARAMISLLQQCRSVKADGRSILIFPEGTRLPVLAKQDYQVGVGMLYKTLRLPVVPIAVNSGIFWPRRSFLKCPGRITVSFLPLIEPGLDTADFMGCIQSRIGAEKDRLCRKPAYRVRVAQSFGLGEVSRPPSSRRRS